jgi:rare lipoprotein A
MSVRFVAFSCVCVVAMMSSEPSHSMKASSRLKTSAHRILPTRASARAASHHSQNDRASGQYIVGAASTYNPFKPGWREGGKQTATGERYDSRAWTAAIQTNLRERFGGVRRGSEAYALVESVGKTAIVKINDVGPLTPGRVIDFNEQTMRYFDPSLKRGIIRDVKVTPLRGTSWSPGPVASEMALSMI